MPSSGSSTVCGRPASVGRWRRRDGARGWFEQARGLLEQPPVHRIERDAAPAALARRAVGRTMGLRTGQPGLDRPGLDVDGQLDRRSRAVNSRKRVDQQASDASAGPAPRRPAATSGWKDPGRDALHFDWLPRPHVASRASCWRSRWPATIWRSRARRRRARRAGRAGRCGRWWSAADDALQRRRERYQRSPRQFADGSRQPLDLASSPMATDPAALRGRTSSSSSRTCLSGGVWPLLFLVACIGRSSSVEARRGPALPALVCPARPAVASLARAQRPANRGLTCEIHGARRPGRADPADQIASSSNRRANAPVR